MTKDSRALPAGANPPANAEEILTYQQVSAEFQIKRGTLFFWVSQRSIPHIRLGPRSVRFRRRELERWLAARTIPVATNDDATQASH